MPPDGRLKKRPSKSAAALLYAHTKASNNVKGYLLEMLLDIYKKHPEVEEALKYGQDACDAYDGRGKSVLHEKGEKSCNSG